eukprot:scaffold27248_cov133-Isochrysis_galbana.AAC.8
MPRRADGLTRPVACRMDSRMRSPAGAWLPPAPSRTRVGAAGRRNHGNRRHGRTGGRWQIEVQTCRRCRAWRGVTLPRAPRRSGREPT